MPEETPIETPTDAEAVLQDLSRLASLNHHPFAQSVAKRATDLIRTLAQVQDCGIDKETSCRVDGLCNRHANLAADRLMDQLLEEHQATLGLHDRLAGLSAAFVLTRMGLRQLSENRRDESNLENAKGLLLLRVPDAVDTARAQREAVFGLVKEARSACDNLQAAHRGTKVDWLAIEAVLHGAVVKVEDLYEAPLARMK